MEEKQTRKERGYNGLEIETSLFLASPDVQRIYHRRRPVAPQRARSLEPHWRRRVGHGNAHAAAELVEHNMHGRRYADDAYLRVYVAKDKSALTSSLI